MFLKNAFRLIRRARKRKDGEDEGDEEDTDEDRSATESSSSATLVRERTSLDLDRQTLYDISKTRILAANLTKANGEKQQPKTGSGETAIVERKLSGESITPRAKKSDDSTRIRRAKGATRKSSDAQIRMKPSRSSPATPKKVVEMAEADKPKLTPEKITQGSQSREDYQAEKLTRSVIEKRLYGEDNQTKGPENVVKDDEATNFAPKASERQSRSRREPRRKASNRSVRERSQRSRRARRNRMATTTAATTATTGMEMTAEEPPTRFPRRAKSNRKKIHNGQKDDGQTMGRTVPNVVIPEIYKKKLKKTSPTQEHSADKESPAVDYWNSPKEKPKYEWMESKDAEKTDLRSVKEVEYGGGKFKQNELPPSQPKSPSRREKNFNNIEQMTREIYGVHDRPLKPPPPQRPATVQGNRSVRQMPRAGNQQNVLPQR